MHDNANDNPLWDAILGPTTDLGVVRLLGLIILFIVVAGSFFWLIGD